MDTSYFEADKDLIELAKKTCDEVNPDIHSYVGRVVSGDQFISDNEKKHYLINEFDGYCAEMEGAAMAQAAHLNQIHLSFFVRSLIKQIRKQQEVTKNLKKRQ